MVYYGGICVSQTYLVLRNYLPVDRISDLSDLKAFADDGLNAAQMRNPSLKG